MCRGTKYCTELGNNPALWDKNIPLPLPSWFKNEIDLFEEVIKKTAAGDVAEGKNILLKIRNEELSYWYCEHGQQSGMFRERELGIKTVKQENIELDKLRSPDKYRMEVFKRDNYTCQYCGIKVVPKEIFAEFSRIVGMDLFRATGTNKERHGIVLAFRANADHVVPWAYGGQTNPDNLVTSCWSCNYGKSGYTLEELGINDPRNRNLNNRDWMGLMNYLPKLKKIPRK